MNYLYHNGSYCYSNSPLFTAENRAFRYGDSVFESIALVKGRIPLLDLHWKRIKDAAQILSMQLPVSFSQDELASICLTLARKNNNPPYARIRLTLYRTDGGLYLPAHSTGQLCIELRAVPECSFSVALKGQNLVIYPQALLTYTPLSGLKTGSALPYIIARIFAQQNEADNCLLLNAQGHIAEAANANIFWFETEDEVIFTPPLTSGCVAGVMRRYLIEQLLPDMGIACVEKPLLPEVLLQVRELLLTNATSGIDFVKSLNGQTYGCELANTIAQQLRIATQCQTN